MVNGAPDDICSWTPDGESFRITNLLRLESETLPSYFRHSRFQSLVRQLNFYNFRKVNRERNFWVYQHPLFHRDRPQELRNLRRKTCPRFDGSKLKNQHLSTDEDDRDMETKATAVATPMQTTSSLVSPESSVKVSRSPSPDSPVEPTNVPFRQHNISSAGISAMTASLISTASTASQDQEDAFSEEQSRKRAHLRIVAQVSRDLNVICSDLSSKKTSYRGIGIDVDTCFGFDKSDVHYSKNKCNFLSYDDDAFVEEEGVEYVQRTADSPRDQDVKPPASNEASITSITNACYEGRLFNASIAQHERHVSSIVLRFLLCTHPEEPDLQCKISSHLKAHPVLQREFHAYSQALDGFDMKHDWISFALNRVRFAVAAMTPHQSNDQVSEDELQAMLRCKDLWF